MITLFAIPKPFVGHTSIIQRNAIKSWINVVGNSEIILLGDDRGVAEAAQEFNLMHIANVDKNEFGTPLLSSAFEIAQQRARNKWLMYINADIVLPHYFCESIKDIRLPQFVISGRRVDVDIFEEFDSFNSCENERFFREAKNNGSLHGYSGMDYFIFPRGQISMPAFAVGRPGWDQWLIWRSKTSRIPVIDASEKMLVVHQNHDFSHSKFGAKTRVYGPELFRNIAVAGGIGNMMSLREADWLLGDNGLRRPTFPRRIFPLLASVRVWQLIILWKRQVHVWWLRRWKPRSMK